MSNVLVTGLWFSLGAFTVYLLASMIAELFQLTLLEGSVISSAGMFLAVQIFQEQQEAKNVEKVTDALRNLLTELESLNANIGND